jgi:hypothetical protein
MRAGPQGQGLDSGESGYPEGPKGQPTDGAKSTEDICKQAPVEHSFEVGDLVFLRLQPYRQSSLKKNGTEKLQPCFYGPYKVIEE